LFNRAPKYDESYGEPIEGNVKLEIVWTLVPLFLVIAIAIYSTKVNTTLQNLGEKTKYDSQKELPKYLDNNEASAGTFIDVISRQWSWEFKYPEGFSSSELHIPIDEKVYFRLISKDVIHGFYIPAFRLKQDIIPGSIISYSLTPTRKGIYRLRDSMFSGAYFSQNQTNVIVESKDAYQEWINKTVKKVPVDGLNQAGFLYKKRLEKGDKGWATISPSPSPQVNDPGNPDSAHEG
jgi:cytochrome c oxidase subunit 2